MTALASAPAAPARTAVAHRPSFARTLRSETIKALTLRSTWWALGVGVSLSVVLPVLLVVPWPGTEATATAYNMVQAALMFVQLVLPVFGVLVITGEFSTGSIRSTLTAQPSRASVVGAKVAVVAGVAAFASLLTYAVVLVVTLPFVTVGLDWSTPEQSTLPILTGLLSTVVLTLVGFGLGLIIRNPGGAISATIAVLYVLPIALSTVWLTMSGGDPTRGVFNFAELLPTQAASMLAFPSEFASTGPLVVLVAWMVIPTLVGGWLLQRRDA